MNYYNIKQKIEKLDAKKTKDFINFVDNLLSDYSIISKVEQKQIKLIEIKHPASIKSIISEISNILLECISKKTSAYSIIKYLDFYARQKDIKSTLYIPKGTKSKSAIEKFIKSENLEVDKVEEVDVNSFDISGIFYLRVKHLMYKFSIYNYIFQAIA